MVSLSLYSTNSTLITSRINTSIEIITHEYAITPENALSLLRSYDVILDCTDNAPTRYLLSDTCVVLNKPLVSGAAQKLEGQLCVYNLGPDGPCYRCLFPTPPRPEFAGTCAELGILGAITGIIGNLQAMEAIKIIIGLAGQFIPLTTPLQCLKVVQIVNRLCCCIPHCPPIRSETSSYVLDVLHVQHAVSKVNDLVRLRKRIMWHFVVARRPCDA